MQRRSIEYLGGITAEILALSAMPVRVALISALPRLSGEKTREPECKNIKI